MKYNNLNDLTDGLIQYYIDEYYTPKKEEKDKTSNEVKKNDKSYNSNIYIGEDELNNELTILFALPGFKKENIDITTNGDLLIVSAEKEKTKSSNEINVYHFNQDITYKVRLSDEYLNGDFSCVFENGELKVQIKAKDTSRVITID